MLWSYEHTVELKSFLSRL